MKKWLMVFLCCFAANAFASAADSGRCPWKMPFTIIIHSIGNTSLASKGRWPTPGSYEEYDTNYVIPASQDSLEITVDTISAYLSNDSIQYSLNSDVLNFSSDYLDTSGIKSPTRYNNGGFFLAKPSLVQKFLTIEFAPGKDSIVSLSVSEIDSGTEFYSGFIPVFISKDDTFKIASLLFSDTDIFASDSSFQGHNSQMIARSISDMNAGWSNQDHTEANFTAYSFNLSGIFRPTHFADQSIVTEVPAKQEALSVTSLNGSLRCSFGASPQERLLEIYSPLGIRTASCSVSPSQTEAIIPRIGTGFYFVRLGGSLAKVFVAE